MDGWMDERVVVVAGVVLASWLRVCGGSFVLQLCSLSQYHKPCAVHINFVVFDVGLASSLDSHRSYESLLAVATRSCTTACTTLALKLHVE
jgi:hypothetical protein